MSCAALWSSGSSWDGRNLKPTVLIVPVKGNGVVHWCAGVGADVECLVDRQLAGMVLERLLVATSLPSTLSTPLPPLPMPGPS